MLKKRQRLTKKEFDQYFKTGQRLHSPLVQLVYAPADDFHGAVVVGKKVFKSAVRRNRLRRQIYAALYHYQQQTEVKLVLIVLVKPSVQQQPWVVKRW